MASQDLKPKASGSDIGQSKASFLNSSLCNENTSCPFYLEIKNYIYTHENRLHMDEFRHQKTLCPYGKECNALIRLNSNGYRHDDIGHCSIYFHQGRRGGMTVEDNFGLKKFFSAHQHWDPDVWCDIKFWDGKTTEGDLVKELKRNGFGYVMKPTSGPYKHMNEIVQEKLRHPRHIRIGSPLTYDQMLAIILYCGTDAYADLRRHEIEYTMQDFEPFSRKILKRQKWPVFSKILDEAIWSLYSADEDHRPAVVYHGLNSIEIDPKTFNNQGRASKRSKDHFKYGTFVSTSWDKQVALGFMGEEGSLLEIDLTGGIVGADVSWISKFPDESEFLIARCVTLDIQKMYFDESHKYQIVQVKIGQYCHMHEPVQYSVNTYEECGNQSEGEV